MVSGAEVMGGGYALCSARDTKMLSVHGDLVPRVRAGPVEQLFELKWRISSFEVFRNCNTMWVDASGAHNEVAFTDVALSWSYTMKMSVSILKYIVKKIMEVIKNVG